MLQTGCTHCILRRSDIRRSSTAWTASALRKWRYHCFIASLRRKPSYLREDVEMFWNVERMLKEKITGDAPERVMLDFEKAAITAARKSVEGCAFHLAQASKRDSLGLRRYIQGLEREEPLTE
ncbi:unnamed protein product [Haemonchus placei]|uniref:MULE domain-containing protein n=1 Tax=Haemonchus placei TaxID=6290 RepID=A0A3P7WHB3_HAEPC|nr:unnamed protein product [Haemonchus placei]